MENADILPLSVSAGIRASQQPNTQPSGGLAPDQVQGIRQSTDRLVIPQPGVRPNLDLALTVGSNMTGTPGVNNQIPGVHSDFWMDDDYPINTEAKPPDAYIRNNLNLELHSSLGRDLGLGLNDSFYDVSEGELSGGTGFGEVKDHS